MGPRVPDVSGPGAVSHVVIIPAARPKKIHARGKERQILARLCKIQRLYAKAEHEYDEAYAAQDLPAPREWLDIQYRWVIHLDEEN